MFLIQWRNDERGGHMVSYTIRRLGQTIPVLLGVVFIVVALNELIPGEPGQLLAGESASPERVEQLRERLGLNRPLYEQYIDYLGGILKGDLGTSLRSGRPVVEEIFETRFWITAQLALVSLGISLLFGLAAGVISALNHGRVWDGAVMLIALLGLSIPNFWLGVILITWFGIGVELFGLKTSWLPVAGWGSWRHMILPALTLGTGGAALIARLTRASLLEVLNQEYIQAARAKGLSEGRIITTHALRNALIPVITMVGLQFGALLGGAVITESIFAINGMGILLVEAIKARDYPVVQGTVLVAAVTFVLINLLVDIAYHLLDKRIHLTVSKWSDRF